MQHVSGNTRYSMFELALATPRVLVNSAAMSRRAWQFWGLLGSASLAFSCSSGQTGSASCASVLSCECESLSGKSFVQADVLTIDDSGVVGLEIDQVLNPNSLLGENDVHRRVVGLLAKSAECNRSGWQQPYVGQRVFASFFVYPEGDASTTPSVSSVLVLPWTDELSLGAGVTVSQSEAPTLSDPETCEAQHPRPATPPCNDTRHIDGGCSISADRAPGTAGGWFTPLLVALAALGIRRRRGGIG